MTIDDWVDPPHGDCDSPGLRRREEGESDAKGDDRTDPGRKRCRYGGMPQGGSRSGETTDDGIKTGTATRDKTGADGDGAPEHRRRHDAGVSRVGRGRPLGAEALSGVVDNIILLRNVEIEGGICSIISILKSRGCPHDKKIWKYNRKSKV